MSLGLALLLLAAAPPASASAAPRPKLVLAISVDSLGSELFARMRPRFHHGFKVLLDEGATLQGRYRYAETVTAAGHATLSTGAQPSQHGIVGNYVFDRESRKPSPLLVEGGAAALRSQTLSDHLIAATGGKSRAIAISVKARAALALGGLQGTSLWFDRATGGFQGAGPEQPAWLAPFNARALADAHFSEAWELSEPPERYQGQDAQAGEADAAGLGRTFPHPLKGGAAKVGPASRAAVELSPFMNDVLVELARAAIEGASLGRRDTPDLLWVSFSSPDLVHHAFGPDSWEMQDMLLRLDQSVGRLIDAAAAAVGGREQLAVLVTADHGGQALPELWVAQGLPAKRVLGEPLEQDLSAALLRQFGLAQAVVAIEGVDVYLSPDTERAPTPGVQLRRAAADHLRRNPEVAFAVARDDLPGARGSAPQALRNSYFPGRSGDVLFVLRQFRVLAGEAHGASHGTPYPYDTDVPVLLWGAGVRKGTYPGRIDPADLAPTLGALLGVGPPPDAQGRARREVLR